MVKRQKEKQYLSAREQRDHQTNRSGASSSLNTSHGFSALPFSHCALTLQPYQTPVCNDQGVMFEKDALTGFVFKHKKDPTTGAKMTTRDIITLNMAKDEETGAWQCPILQKTFGAHVKVVAILQRDAENTANVYSYEAYQELNVKTRNYEDLTSGRPFDKKKDVLVLCDPENESFNQKRDISQFYHIQHERELQKDDAGGTSHDIRHSMTAARVMDKLKKKKRSRQEAEGSKSPKNAPVEPSKRHRVATSLDGAVILAQDVTGVEFNTAQGASSFTSTGVDLAQDAAARPATEEEILQAEFYVMKTKLKGRKGYVLMNLAVQDEDGKETTMPMTLELHTDIAPRTCANFLGLCAQGSYDGCEFHRLIPKFMMQGGKALDDDTEDESFWGGPVPDEFDERLKHVGPGILSMANAGTGTTRRQFFITFASCQHLDRKHSVLGKVVRGAERLTDLQAIATDKHDKPVQSIKIVSMDVVENPAQVAHDMEQQRLKEILESRRKKGAAAKPTNKTVPVAKRKEAPGEDAGVGHYLRDKLKKQTTKTKTKTTTTSSETDVGTTRLPAAPKKTSFGNFGGW